MSRLDHASPAPWPSYSNPHMASLAPVSTSAGPSPASSSSSWPSQATARAPSHEDASHHSVPKPKRKRITQEQLNVLTELFESTNAPSYEVREATGAKLGMTNREVQVWFQNRRAKVNRQKLAAAAAAAASTAGVAYYDGHRPMDGYWSPGHPGWQHAPMVYTGSPSYPPGRHPRMTEAEAWSASGPPHPYMAYPSRPPVSMASSRPGWTYHGHPGPAPFEPRGERGSPVSDYDGMRPSTAPERSYGPPPDTRMYMSASTMAPSRRICMSPVSSAMHAPPHALQPASITTGHRLPPIKFDAPVSSSRTGSFPYPAALPSSTSSSSSPTLTDTRVDKTLILPPLQGHFGSQSRSDMRDQRHVPSLKRKVSPISDDEVQRHHWTTALPTTSSRRDLNTFRDSSSRLSPSSSRDDRRYPDEEDELDDDSMELNSDESIHSESGRPWGVKRCESEGRAVVARRHDDRDDDDDDRHYYQAPQPNLQSKSITSSTVASSELPANFNPGRRRSMTQPSMMGSSSSQARKGPFRPW